MAATATSITGANDQSVASTQRASAGGPARDPRLPVCASSPLTGPIARLSAATSGTEANAAAGTSPPSAKQTAKPATASGTGAAALNGSAAITVEAIRPTATSRPGEAPRRISRPAQRLPAIPKAAAMATIRPASSAGSPRRSTSQAGNNPASARKTRAKQKKATGRGNGGTQRSGRHAPLVVLRSTSLWNRHRDDQAEGQQDGVDGENDPPTRAVGEGRRCEPRKRDAGRHEGAPQRQRESMVPRFRGADHQRGAGDDDQQITGARQPARGEQHVGAAGHRAKRCRRGHDENADAERAGVTDPLRTSRPPAGRTAHRRG